MHWFLCCCYSLQNSLCPGFHIVNVSFLNPSFQDAKWAGLFVDVGLVFLHYRDLVSCEIQKIHVAFLSGCCAGAGPPRVELLRVLGYYMSFQEVIFQEVLESLACMTQQPFWIPSIVECCDSASCEHVVGVFV